MTLNLSICSAILMLLPVFSPGFAQSDVGTEDELRPVSVSAGGPPGMIWIPGGEFTMGSNDTLARPSEKPPHRLKVDGFFMDPPPVTNAQFRAFVDATGYVTTAEKPADLAEIMTQLPPGTPQPEPEMLEPASVVFSPPVGQVPLNNYFQWWSYVKRAQKEGETNDYRLNTVFGFPARSVSDRPISVDAGVSVG